jgi:hypothetical protein
MFNDITTLLLRPAVFKDAVDIFLERYRGMSIDAVAGKQQPAPRPCPLHPCPPRSTWSSREVAVARRGAEFWDSRDIFAGDLPRGPFVPRAFVVALDRLYKRNFFGWRSMQAHAGKSKHEQSN